MEDKEIYLDIFDNDFSSKEYSDFEEENLDDFSKDIAIVGMSAKTSYCENIDQLWQSLINGEELIRDFPQSRLEDIKDFKKYLGIDIDEYRKESFLNNIDLFSPDFFQILPKDASLIDPAQRLFLMSARHAIEDANISIKKLRGSNTGVYVGYSTPEYNYSQILANSNEEFNDRATVGKVNSIIASRLSYRLDLKAPAVMIDTACSSSLSAVHYACKSIINGECEQAIVGSVKIDLIPSLDNDNSSISVESDDYKTRSFDILANGTNPGEGVAAIFLKPLLKAKADNDRIYAVIKASKINQDGKSVGITAPNAKAQEELLINCRKDCDIDPKNITYIEAHGTATKLGDPIEITAIDRAFKKFSNRKQFCGIGTLKANIGHLDCSSGIFGLIKCILQLYNKTLIGQINYSSANRDIDFINSSVYINEKNRYRKSNDKRVCGVSSFGMSGTNCHILLEEFKDIDEKNYDKEKFEDSYYPLLLPLSARNKEELIEVAKDFKIWAQNNTQKIAYGIYTYAISRSDYKLRSSILINSPKDLDDLDNKVIENYDKSKDYDYSYIKKAEELMDKENYSKEDLMLLADIYNMGIDVDWNKVYRNYKLKKTSIPNYPIKLTRCRQEPIIVKKSKDKILGKEIKNSYHKDLPNEVLLDRCILNSPILNIYESIFSTDSHKEVKEHIIKDKHVLAGTVYIEMIKRISEIILPEDNIEIRNLLFKNAMVFEDEEQIRQIHTIFYKTSKESYSVIIQSKPYDLINEDNERVIHIEAEISLVDFKLDKSRIDLSIKSLIGKMKRLPHKDQKSSVAQVVKTGPRWSIDGDIYIDKDSALTEIMIYYDYHKEMNDYSIYPPMLDAGVNFSSILNGDELYLPYFFGSIKIYDKFPPKIYSYSVKNSKGSSSNGEITVFDIKITDEKGKILALIDNYSMKKVSDVMQKQFQKTTPMNIHKLKWEKVDNIISDRSESKSDNLNKQFLVIRSIDDYNEKLTDNLSQNIKDNLNEMIICDREMRDSPHKYYTYPYDYEKIASIFSMISIKGIDEIIFMIKDKREIENLSDTDDLIESILLPAFNIIRALALNKKLGNIKINLLLKTKLHKIDPIARSIVGMMKSLSLEYNRLKIRSILYDDKTNYDQIINEILSDNKHSPIFLSNTDRYEESIGEITDDNAIYKDKFKIKKNGTYLITGGLGGIGLNIADLIAETESDIHLILTSRKKLLPKTDWINQKEDLYKRLSDISNKIAKLSYIPLDIADECAVDTIYEKIGKIDGIIHSAGIAGGGFLIKKNRKDFREVLKPKMDGSINIINLAKKSGSEFITLFSSYSTILPIAGQSDYIAANSFIDGLINNDINIPIKVINWSGWKQSGMAFDNNIDLSSSPVEFLMDEEGKLLFKKAMRISESQIFVGELKPKAISDSDINYLKLIKLPDHIIGMVKKESAGKKSSIEDLDIKVLGNDLKLTDTENKVAKSRAKVLGLSELNYHDKFLEIGGDSLSATYLQKELDKIYPNIVDITDIFIYSSIKEMAEYIDQNSISKDSSLNLSINENQLNNEDLKLEDENLSNFNKEEDIDEVNINGELKEDIKLRKSLSQIEILSLLADGEIDAKQAAKYL